MQGLIPHSAKRVVESFMARVMPARNNRVAVLCYHSIDPATTFASATPELFHDHLQWLTDHCDVVSLDAITEHAGQGRPDRPVVAITFDDGYFDNHLHALPALVEHGFPATFFLTTGLLGGDPEVIEHLRRLWGSAEGEIVPLSWSQVAELQAAGMRVGAHTHGHTNLARIGADRAKEEISRSKEILEDRLGVSVDAFAYPFGKPRQHFSQETVELVAGAGFASAVSILYRGVRAIDSDLLIPRFAITNDSVEMLKAKVLGKIDFVGTWQERAPQWIAGAVSVDVSQARN